MTSQVVCRGCRSVLLYPSGAAKVSCVLCSTVTSIPPPGMAMDHLICGGCRTLLMYERGAKTVKCTCCDKVNLAPALKCWIASKNTPNAVASPEPANVDDLEKRFASLQQI